MFVGLDAASSESGDAWEGFLTGLGERGLRCPLLVISDGAAGLIGALERTMGAALRQRCLVHRARNVLAKVPKNAQAQVKADYWAIFDVPDTIEPGLDAVGYVQKRIDSFEKRWRDAYPAAVRCLLDDRDSCSRCTCGSPREHWTRVRHPNFIERSFGETRRRVKVIASAPASTRRLEVGVGGARPRLGRVARIHHDTGRAAAAGRLSPEVAGRPACPTAATEFASSHRNRRGATDSAPSRRITTVSERNLRPNFYTAPGTPPCRRTHPTPRHHGRTIVPHGCLNLDVHNVEWIFNFSQPGDIVDVRYAGSIPGSVRVVGHAGSAMAILTVDGEKGWNHLTCDQTLLLGEFVNHIKGVRQCSAACR